MLRFVPSLCESSVEAYHLLSSRERKALHTWIWGFSALFPCRSSQALLGWMEAVSVGLFSGSFGEIQVTGKTGPLKDVKLGCRKKQSHSVVFCVSWSLSVGFLMTKQLLKV